MHGKVIDTSSMENQELNDALEKDMALALITVSPCNSSEEKNILHDTIYIKRLDVFCSRKKKPLDLFQANTDTMGLASDHKRFARLTYLDSPCADNLAKLKDDWAAAQHTTREAYKSFWNDICLSVQNCNDFGDIAGMHAVLKCSMGATYCLTALLRDLNGNVLCEKLAPLNCWIEHFSQLYGSEVLLDDSALDFLDQMWFLNHLDICPDITEVISSFNVLKSGKAPGSDDIQIELLKLGIPCLTVEIHQVMLSCWWESFIQQDMKDAKLITLFKNKGLRRDCNRYHAISLLSLIRKVSGRVILK